jgi:hypothetical protein
MSDTDNGRPEDVQVEEAPKSLREIAEQSWNEVEAEAAEEAAQETGEPQTGQEGRSRDSLGRFAPSGEQSQDPAPGTQIQAPTGVQPHPAPEGSSSEAPAHWSPEDRNTFQKLPKEGQDFLLRRHTEMERDYQGKVQQSATAVQFTQAVAPVFEEPRLKASLANVDGRPLHPVHAIQQWAAFHLRAMDPDPRVRQGLLQELAQRMQLDPAALGNSPPQGLSEQDMADPAIRYFVDHVGKTVQEVQALRGELNTFKASEQERQNEAVLRTTRQGIDSFAEAKDPQGNKLYPHFDAVLPQLIELFRVDPNRDLKEAYDTAVWMAPTVRQGLLQQERSRDEQKRQNGRASLAARGNIRGRTSPVSKPDTNGTGPKSLRDTIAAAADEVGFEG